MASIISSFIYVYFILTISQTSAAPDNGGFFYGPTITDRDPSVKKCRHRKVFGMIQAMCADLNLKQIPPNLQSNIQDLEFSGNRLRELNNNTLLPYTSLSYVYFVDNFISSIEDGAFIKLQNLQVLDLTTNAITGFPKNVLSLPQLRSLYLSDNKLEDDALEPISSLEDSTVELLDLSKNLLTKLPPARAFTQLKELNVSANSISTIKASDVSAFCSLHTLDLSKNRLTFDDSCECLKLNAWIKFRKIKILPQKIICDSSTSNTDKCSVTQPLEQLISNETLRAYDNCKNNIVMHNQMVRTRTTWIVVSSCFIVIIIALIVLFLIYKRNAKRKFRNKKELAASHQVNDELLNVNSINDKK
ncbi:GSCOCG00006377001-RA-CDS [Cotesia congregata]|uniref:Similar to let-4: Leucine-rich repeat-containing protein let-4 (Caenorhabditis elegans) n=1 Tax=Cotesia congregata TaxID=51543 RepID=A0A8J2MUD5_COTCN|nr:GSCOCG00006377001-RA-CDS [Cotesia congregata]CAG5096263.1 Similar to let-4: Leucine-rich repeat-containing protein let-4 (Caenorhabditis elegans) [Cotesia congregata]